ncbi:MAG: hypothetical protein R3B90_21085 [Planctomycetaceae bacterium]
MRKHHSPKLTRRLLSRLCIVGILLITSAVLRADDVEAILAFPGSTGEWHGFTQHNFEVGGKPVQVVAPRQPAPGRPWVWHGEFFGHKPAPDIALLERGFHIVYLRVPDMLGSPPAVEHWNACYHELTHTYRLAPKVALVGLSRGGLYCYNWAIANPDKVACIYGDAPVCDFKSWPGGHGQGPGHAPNWQLVLKLWGFANDDEAIAYQGNPVDNLAPLAAADVPLLHVYGDADEVVPWDENTGVIANRYRDLGGRIALIAKPGVGHHPHGLEDSTPIVEFITHHALQQFEREELLFADAFDREESQPDIEEIGNGWTTNSAWRAGGKQQVDLDGQVMRVTRVPEADHGVAIFHDAALTDGRVALRFKLSAGDDLGVDFVDRDLKTVHAGHLFMARVTPTKLTILDSKTGHMDLKIREQRQAGELPEGLQTLLASKQANVPLQLDTEVWHSLAVEIRGDQMRVLIDGLPAGRLVSEGIAHPTKRRITLAVNHHALIDDVRVWKTVGNEGE